MNKKSSEAVDYKERYPNRTVDNEIQIGELGTAIYAFHPGEKVEEDRKYAQNGRTVFFILEKTLVKFSSSREKSRKGDRKYAQNRHNSLLYPVKKVERVCAQNGLGRGFWFYLSSLIEVRIQLCI